MKTTLTVKELYDLTPEQTITGTDVLFYSELLDHIEQETDDILGLGKGEYIGNEYDIANLPQDYPIEVRYLKQHCFDGRRTWVMAIAYWKDIPFMIYKNYGRDNDEYMECYVTNREVMMDFINSLLNVKYTKEQPKPDVSEDDEISIDFYQCNLLNKDSFVYWK